MSNAAELPVVMEESHEVALVDFVLVSKTGTALDAPGKEGALSLALRSLRRGAAGRRAAAIDEQVDRLGAEFATSADASTSSAHVTVIRRNVEPMMALLADLVMRPDFPEAEIAQVIRETHADIVDSRNDDRTLAARFFRRHLFAGHPYGRPAAGTLASLERLSRGDAIARFDETFAMGNLVVGAAGDIARDELDRLIAKHWSSFERTPIRSVPVPEPTRRKGRHLLIVDKPERTQTQIYIGGLGTHTRDRDHTALHVANTIFGGTFTARLMREVRSKRGWSYGASSRLGRDRAREAWWMWTFPAARDAAACIELQLRLLDDWVTRGVTARELAFVKQYLVRSHAFEVDTATKRLMQRLDEIVMPLPRNYHREYVARVEAVKLDDVNAAIRRRISADDLLVTIVATASDLRAPLEAAVSRLASSAVVPFDSDALPK